MNEDVIDVDPVEAESVERKSLVDMFAEKAGAALGEAINKADDAKDSLYETIDKAHLEQKATEAAQRAEETITSAVDSFAKGFSSKR